MKVELQIFSILIGVTSAAYVSFLEHRWQQFQFDLSVLPTPLQIGVLHQQQDFRNQ
jgi:hypothetical protein